jgi:hypothetical protein
LNATIAHEFSNSQSNALTNTILGARYALSLFDPVRSAGETLIAAATMPFKSGVGIKGIKGVASAVTPTKRKVFAKLLEDTNSSLGLKDSKHVDVKGASEGVFDKKNIVARAAQWTMSFPEQATMIISWDPVFRNEFKKITGENFNESLYLKDPKYLELNKDAIMDAASIADKELSKMYGGGTKAESRRKVDALFGKFDSNSVPGKLVSFFGSFAYREQGEFFNSAKSVLKDIKDRKGFDSVTSKEAGKVVGVISNALLYSYYMGGWYLLQKALLSDDEEEKDKAWKELELFKSPEKLANNIGAQISFLGLAKYGTVGRTILGLGLNFAWNQADKNTKEGKAFRQTVESIMRDQLYKKPYDSKRYGSLEKDAVTLIPMVDMIIRFFRSATTGEASVPELAKKVANKGFDSLTETERDKWILAQSLMNTVNLALLFKGTQLPMTKTIERFMRGKAKDKPEARGTKRRSSSIRPKARE